MATSISRYELLTRRVIRVEAALKRARHADPSSMAPLQLHIRRLREVLPILRLDAGDVRRIDHRLRKGAARLKPILTFDAMMAAAEDTAAGERGSRGDVRVRNELRRHRIALRVPSSLRKASADIRKALAKAAAITAALEDGKESAVALSARRWAVKARVARRAADLKRALADAGAVYLPGRLDPLHRAARRLSLGAALLADVGAPVHAADLKAIDRLNDALGRLRANERLIRRLRRFQAELTPAGLKTWQELDDLIVPLEHRCRRLHARYVRERDALALAAERLSDRPMASTSSRRKAS